MERQRAFALTVVKRRTGVLRTRIKRANFDGFSMESNRVKVSQGSLTTLTHMPLYNWLRTMASGNLTDGKLILPSGIESFGFANERARRKEKR
jgi:hypothetical protein